MNHNHLFQDPSIKKLCMLILDKADDKPLMERGRVVSFPVNKVFFPELFEPTRVGNDVILEETIIELSTTVHFDLIFAKRKQFLPLSKRDAKIRINPESEQWLREIYGRLVKVNEWDKALEKHEFKSEKAKEVLSTGSPIRIPTKSPVEVIEAFDEWASQDTHRGTVRQESAKCFWAMSKVFDHRRDIIDGFGLRETPVMLNIYSKSEFPNKVLFIENQDTYYMAIESDNDHFKDMVLIYSSGYKATAKRIRKPEGNRMFFEANCNFSIKGKEEFILWFNMKNEAGYEVYFWGDLDLSGVGILTAFREHFPQLIAWEKGYEKMLKSVQQGHAHSAEMSKKANQVEVENSGCAYTDRTLSPYLKEIKLFVDQELINM